MRILEVCSYLYPALTYGGPAKVVYDLSVELAKNNQVTIYTTDVFDEYNRISQKLKVKSQKSLIVRYFINIINNIVYKYRLFTGFGMMFAYLKEKNNFDIIHIHDLFIIPQLLIAVIAQLFHKPYVISPHGILDPLRMKQKSVFKTFLYELLAKRVLQNAKKIIATSDSEKRDLKKLGFKNVVTVYNGISMGKTIPSQKFQKFKRNNLFTILYIGKLHPLKGLDDLLYALRDITFSYQCLIAGPDDGALSNLKNIIIQNNLKNVYFLGYVNEHEKAELYSLADIFVYPSKSEGFSMSILEALKYSVPVLITKECNFPEVQKYRVGFILRIKEIKNELVKKIIFMNNNFDELLSMKNNTKKLILKKFSIKSMADQIVNIYCKNSLKRLS